MESVMNDTTYRTLVLAVALAGTGCDGTEPGETGSGGTPGSGGVAATGGTTSTGGTVTATGGKATGGTTTATGGTSTGGTATGGKASGGTASGGKATGGTATGGAGSITGPCDIYASASTPCVAAYSTVRRLSSTYSGPLYQVRKGGSSLGSGGTTADIGALADGFADGAAQDTACGTSGACTVSILYDQSGRGNNLKVAPAGCYSGTASEPDYESNAKGRSLNASGHKVYALYTIAHDGYRNNAPSGVPTEIQPQGLYMVTDGKRYGGACCFDFGNAGKDNCYGTTGIMDALFFGTGYWGKGAGSGPWFMADFEAGVWAGGSGASNAVNSNLPSSTMDYAFGILKTTSTSSASTYAIRVGNAQSGGLTTAYDGAAPKVLRKSGAIILGIGGDNSNSSYGTFFEGAMTAGRPSDATDAAVLANVQAARYGQ
jgi:hypothetical protein